MYQQLLQSKIAVAPVPDRFICEGRKLHTVQTQAWLEWLLGLTSISNTLAKTRPAGMLIGSRSLRTASENTVHTTSHVTFHPKLGISLDIPFAHTIHKCHVHVGIHLTVVTCTHLNQLCEVHRRHIYIRKTSSLMKSDEQ